jgi:hypothetical protein
MDFNTCNHKKLNQFQSEAKRWKAGDKESKAKPAKRGLKTQPPKRKK